MNKICLVAVDIRSTHNIGSMLRTADGFSADVALCGITPRPVGLDNEDRLPHVILKTNNAIAKTALGAEKTVDVKYFKNAFQAVSYYKKKKYKVFAIEQHENSKPLTDFILNKNTAFLLGPEVSGLDEKTIELCDDVYEIAMTGKKESFNVSIAAGITLYQARLQN